MPINRQERESIIATVKVQVLAEIVHLIGPPTGQFNVFWKKWGPLFATISPVAMALIGVLYWQYGVDLNKHIDDRIATAPLQTAIRSLADKGDKLNDSVGDMNTRLSKLEGSIDQLSKDLHTIFDDRLHHLSELSQPQFEAEIPKLPAMVRLASAGGFSIDPNLIDALRHRLASTPLNNASAWEAAATIITASSLRGNVSPQPIKPAVSFTYGFMADVTGTVQLDGGDWEHFTFKNVHLAYSGGPLILKNVHFINCTFSVDLRSVPSSSGQQLTKTLLASNLSDVKID
jgi:hypothetical protein